MTNYIILALCIIVVLAYIFDISGKYSRIPSVILLIFMGIVLQLVLRHLPISIPNLQPVLPVIGTIGLILIVLEASLDLKLEKSKKGIILKSITAAFFLFLLFTTILTFMLTKFFGYSFKDSILNAMPLGIISSAVAIPAASLLKPSEKEFVVYESSFSDIFGIIFFDFILLGDGPIGDSIMALGFKSLITIVLGVVTTLILAALLHKISYHVNYVLIITSIVLIYTLAKMLVLPALLLVMIFGLTLSNNHLLERDFLKKYVNFEKFRTDIKSFKTILIELTFLVRSLFFIIFGFYVKVEGLLQWDNLLIASAITLGIFLLRYLFFKFILRMNPVPLVYFGPRGLITILLFISIPQVSRIPFLNEEVITIVILMTIILMTVGNMVSRGEKPEALLITEDDKPDPQFIPTDEKPEERLSE